MNVKVFNLPVRLLLIACLSIFSFSVLAADYYVTADGSPVGSGKWSSSVTSLQDALNRAEAGDCIHLLGYSSIGTPDIYVTPDKEGFKLKAGVSVIGGYAPDGTRPTLRGVNRFIYQSVLSADINKNDIANSVTVIYPTNNTRTDNAHHVLSVDIQGNNTPTMIDGVTIMGANAENAFGGGIYIYASNARAASQSMFTIKNCFIHNNYASSGGGVYIAAQCLAAGSKIIDCVIAGNVAGNLGEEVNVGAGLCLLGMVDVVNVVVNNNTGGGVLLGHKSARLVNNTIAHNTVAAVDVTDSYNDIDCPDVYNTAIWNNEFLTSVGNDIKPDFFYCAAHEFDNPVGSNNNVYIGTVNALSSEASTFFIVPTELNGYEFSNDALSYAYPDADWSISEYSALLNKGDDKIIGSLGVNTDLFGRARRIDGKVDIGAYEADIVDEANIFHVNGTTGDDANDGQSWSSAKKSVQAAIDAAAEVIKDGVGYAEVWIAEGIYFPTFYMLNEQGKYRLLSFRMRDRVNVYGGFAGTETNKNEREKYKDEMPWQYTHETILCGSDYVPKSLKWNNISCAWEGSASVSSHVVWHAPLEGEKPFSSVTRLEGVTVMGGNANGQSAALQDDYYNEYCGGGIYVGFNAYVDNCIVTECFAQDKGGAVYLNGGRVTGSLICSNSAEDGGGVYVDGYGLVLRSMILNNGAKNGAGVYMQKSTLPSNYLILSTSIVNSNTVSSNGAIYCNDGGVVVHCTVTNNNSKGTIDEASPNSPRTGGIYADKYVDIINSILWNNYVDKSPIQLYVKNPSKAKTRFYNTAISNKNMIVWNEIFQKDLILLSENNSEPHISSEVLAPNFSLPTNPDGSSVTDQSLKNQVGVMDLFDYDMIYYYWMPSPGSGLRAMGLPYFGFPVDVLITPEVDLKGNAFIHKPSLGAMRVENIGLKPRIEGNRYVLYIDTESPVNFDGSSWNKPFRSVNDAISYFASLKTLPPGVSECEVRILEAVIAPAHNFEVNDLKSASISVPHCQNPDNVIRISGGYSRADVKAGKTGANVTRRPVLFPTVIHANKYELEESDALYHCMRVASDAKLVVDGLYITGGVSITDKMKFGAGVVVDEGADVRFENSVIFNHYALGAPAIYAPNAKISMVNSVVANNSLPTEAENEYEAAVVAASLSLEHCSFVNNECLPYIVVNDNQISISNSLFAGNKSKDFDIHAVVVDEATFLNPSTEVGYQLSLPTYTGDYPLFVPLTSSGTANEYIINKANKSNVTNDIMLRQRNLGGLPDLGAYEADLPARGRVYYVRTDGNDNNDGLSWSSAFATIDHALDVAEKGEVINGAKPEVWVAAGIYSADPLPGSDNCFVIRDGVSVYGAFPPTGSPSMSDRHPLVSQYINQADASLAYNTYETIIQPKSNTQGIGRVLGQEDKYNPIKSTYRYDKVPEGNGDFLYIITPGYYTNSNGNINIAGSPRYYKHFTSQEKRGCKSKRLLGVCRDEKGFVYVGAGKGDYNIDNKEIYTYVGLGKGVYREFTSIADYEVASNVTGGVLLKQGRYSYIDKTNDYHNVGSGNGNYQRTRIVNKSFNYATVWDGFTVRNGSLNSGNIAHLGAEGKRNGGSGVLFFDSVTIRNFVVTDNINFSTNSGQELRGGAVYCDGGTLVNSYVVNNKLGNNREQHTAYGGGVYMFVGSAYNCVIARNIIEGAHADGAGIFLEGGEFYNNTIVKNEAKGKKRSNGGICIWKDLQGGNLVIYNCISTGNIGNMGYPLADVASVGGIIEAYNSIFGDLRRVDNVTFDQTCKQYGLEIFKNPDAKDYRLKGTVGINTGENIPVVNGKVINLFDYTDMDYTARIKDCTVDAGAFEFDNSENIRPDVNGVYYVTFDGSGTADGSSPENAACAMKLQDVLNVAGKRIVDNLDNLSVTATVKISGCVSGEQLVYNTARLSDPHDPQSYTYTIPYGVTVLGGYSEEFTEADNTRNIYDRITSLTPVVLYKGLKVAGYHVLTFAEPAREVKGRQTIVDGLWLQGGSATSTSLGRVDNTRGGAAIVPAWVHLRNCIITDCSAAKEGGALYIKPGATVSGCLIKNNSAYYGGGVYTAGGSESTVDNRTRFISNTVYNNSATEGGGIFFENKSIIGINCVVFGNKAMSDFNVSGDIYEKYIDSEMSKWTTQAGHNRVDYFYPFNNTFVETLELPSNFNNYAMTGDFDDYFRNTECELRVYSPLIKAGIGERLQRIFEDSLYVSSYDIVGQKRITDPNLVSDKGYIDAGSRAFAGGVLPLPKTKDEIVKVLFISHSSKVQTELSPELIDNYAGRSFITPITNLDRALDYISRTRSSNPDFVDEEFVLLISGGTYKPSNTREDASIGLHDQRENSFLLPRGVKVYGGFSGNEMLDGKPVSYKLQSITVGNENTEFTSMTDDSRIAELKDIRTYHDDNTNGIFEPWEFAEKTIFSGDVNISPLERNVYHVIYSDGRSGSVTLDGITVMDGETANALEGEFEIGRGGAIYSDSIDYNLFNCRFLNNKAVRGNAIYNKDATLKISGCLFAGNSSVLDTSTIESSGGAIYTYLGADSKDSLQIINSLFVNNEVGGRGAVLAFNGEASNSNVQLMNCIIARNKATYTLFEVPQNLKLTNTVVWGNEVGKLSLGSNNHLYYSAADAGMFDGYDIDNCITISKSNMAVNGPRFASPSQIAGVEGYDLTNKWNFASISVLVDAGNGYVTRMGDYDENNAQGAYADFLKRFGNKIDYIKQVNNGASVRRYVGRNLLEDEKPEDFPYTIDIGMYEYLYPNDLSQLDTIYVDLVEKGLATGDSWANAISSVDAAIRAVCMSTGGKTTDKCIMIKGGEYSLAKLVNGVAFRMQPRKVYNGADVLTSISIKGSYNSLYEQDFAKPTLLRVNPISEFENIKILEVSTNGVDVKFDGITLGDYSYNRDKEITELIGIDMTVDDRSDISVNHSCFINCDYGLWLSDVRSSLLLSNVLFADNDMGAAVQNNKIADNVTIVNATFANNTVADISHKITKVYNTVSYRNGKDNIENDASKNNCCLSAYDNNDVLNGPNFVDPFRRLSPVPNYSIRPSLKLIDKGSNEWYTNALNIENVDNEKDLAGLKRVVSSVIDCGAFEYNSEMIDTVFVKAGVAGDNSGRDWDNAMSDLQMAVDHAGIAALRPGHTGVVMVHPNFGMTNTLNVSLGNVKIYGTMVDGVSQVSDVKQRQGLLLSPQRSVLSAINVSAKDVVVDGFEIKGTSPLTFGNNVFISTSIIKGDVQLNENDTLYNSLVLGKVSGGKGIVVNTTALGDIESAVKYNVVEKTDSVMDYVSAPYWRYQLHDTTKYIDGATEPVGMYTNRAGHERDITGAKRTRTKLDCGCFESWYLSVDTEINADDMPAAYRHVIYVDKSIELSIAEDMYSSSTSPFAPACLIMKHGAELRGNGNFIALKKVGVEREFIEGQPLLLSMPFSIMDVSVDGKKLGGFLSKKEELFKSVSVMRYDGMKRAAHDYMFDNDTSSAWDSIFTNVTLGIHEGLLFNPHKTSTIRFIGNNYYESHDAKQLKLKRYNYNEEWSGNDKYTHAENMSWNLVGSPYLCTMNYDDMQYGRMIYKLNNKSYTPINTAGDGVSGNIPVGTAFFTQTATLAAAEYVNVKARKDEVAPEIPQRGMLNIAIRNIDRDNQTQYADNIGLRAVPSQESLQSYNIYTDAVKINALDDDVDEIYIVQNGYRYSILDAVDIDGTVNLGVKLSTKGNYELFIPEYADHTEYDVVALHDDLTGKVVDLKQTGYAFYSSDSGEINNRFRITFKCLTDTNSASPVVYSPKRGVVTIENLNPLANHTIRVYDATGRMLDMHNVQSDTDEFYLPADAAYVIQIISEVDGLEMISIHKVVTR